MDLEPSLVPEVCVTDLAALRNRLAADLPKPDSAPAAGHPPCGKNAERPSVS
jgi:hypothetical protein